MCESASGIEAAEVFPACTMSSATTAFTAPILRAMAWMIRSFRDTETGRLFRRERGSKLARPLRRAALRKLLLLDAAESLDATRTFAQARGLKLEQLERELTAHDQSGGS